VPVAYEEAYNAYRVVIIWTIGQHRPHFTLLGPTLQRFEPHAVVSSRPSAEYPGA
jgi:hypothetical protein